MPRDDGAEGGSPSPAPSAPTEAMPEGLLATGQVLGDRYQIRSQLEVALKALRAGSLQDENGGSSCCARRSAPPARWCRPTSAGSST